jgi:hypothetical protein
LGSIPAIYKEDAKRPENGSKLNRTDKLSGDVKSDQIAAREILDVHNAPTDMQESN